MIDFDLAYEEVQRVEEEKKKQHLAIIQEQERLKLEEEFNAK